MGLGLGDFGMAILASFIASIIALLGDWVIRSCYRSSQRAKAREQLQPLVWLAVGDAELAVKMIDAGRPEVGEIGDGDLPLEAGYDLLVEHDGDINEIEDLATLRQSIRNYHDLIDNYRSLAANRVQADTDEPASLEFDKALILSHLREVIEKGESLLSRWDGI